MADKAYLVTDDGQRIEVNAADCTEADKRKRYICCGEPRGVLCGARMSLVMHQNGGNNEFAARGHSRHRPFCRYDESSKFGKIKYTDPTGANTTIDGLYAIFNRAGHDATGGGGRKSGAGPDGGKVPEIELEEEIRQIMRVPGRPKNFEHLVLLLLSLHEDDTYANVRVGDLFLDHRSIREHRRNGIPDGQTAIAICKRTKQGAEYKVGNNSFVLVDGFYFEQDAGDEKLFFVVETDRRGRDIFLHADQEQKIAIFARWHRHPTAENVYISSEPVNKRCITVIDEKEFEIK